jgi:glutamyl-tRNA synthetase
MGGKFILRIEDTDRERSTDEHIEGIIEGLKWLGVDWDEGPFRQTERFDIYKKHIDTLIEKGLAYHCYCSPEELDARRKEAMKTGKPLRYNRKCRENPKPVEGIKPVVRFKMPLEGSITIEDMIKGQVTFQNEELDDLIIARSDGTPTYNLVVVADDVDMGITHIIRGEDHLNNTPKQAHIYKALGSEPPKFAHQSLILGPDKGKMSKRHGATSVLDYRETGYLPTALVNYLMRLGWSYGDQEVFTREELIKLFSMENVGTSHAVYDVDKLNWLNHQHIMKAETDDLIEAVTPFLTKSNITHEDINLHKERLSKAIPHLKERSRTLIELASSLGYIISDKVEFDPKAKKKFLKPETKKPLVKIRAKIAALGSTEHDAIEAAFKETIEEFGIKLKDLAQPVRVALTGGTTSPGIYDLVEILGKESTSARLDNAINTIEDEE